MCTPTIGIVCASSGGRGGTLANHYLLYRMTAHLFGAISSPACATFGLRHITEEFPGYGQDVVDFVSRDFYVDDGLKSVCDEEAAISLVSRTVALCKERGVRLHKFSSNSKALLNSLPNSECTERGNSLDLDLGEGLTERVLGFCGICDPMRSGSKSTRPSSTNQKGNTLSN